MTPTGIGTTATFVSASDGKLFRRLPEVLRTPRSRNGCGATSSSICCSPTGVCNGTRTLRSVRAGAMTSAADVGCSVLVRKVGGM